MDSFVRNMTSQILETIARGEHVMSVNKIRAIRNTKV
jgi:hypothetical protein